MIRAPILVALATLTTACGGSSTTQVAPVAHVDTPPSYEVHEWGLVRGTANDGIQISGPHAAAPVFAVTKPVLYFHRIGDGALSVDVEARIPSGRVVEHWPSMGPSTGSVAAWHDVLIQGSACADCRYPSLQEEPCRSLTDGCESATLASVETRDSSCLYWPRPPDDDGPTQAWNHLFYRGEVPGSHALPLHVESMADGSIRLTTTSATPFPGRVLRIRHALGRPGLSDGIAVAPPPTRGGSTLVPVPRDPLSSGPAALAATLREAGLTTAECDAFARAWNEALFTSGIASVSTSTRTEATTTTTTMPLPPPPSTTILYVLPMDAADAIATLHFTPPPTAVRRAIVVWIDETAAH